MLNGKENKILKLTFDFSMQIISRYRTLVKQNEFVLSKQLLRSATGIGANVEEANTAQTKKKILLQKCLSPQRSQGKQDTG